VSGEMLHGSSVFYITWSRFCMPYASDLTIICWYEVSHFALIAGTGYHGTDGW
jgi:hypothetical protein